MNEEMKRAPAESGTVSGERHPQQPIVTDPSGVARFKENAIVSHIVDWCASRNGRAGYPPFRDGPAPDLTEIASMKFSREDRVQLAQLIGYSLSGFSELSYVEDADVPAPPLSPATPSAELIAAADALVDAAGIALGATATTQAREGLRVAIAAYDAARRAATAKGN